jgi:hypothetical protein
MVALESWGKTAANIGNRAHFDAQDSHDGKMVPACMLAAVV